MSNKLKAILAVLLAAVLSLSLVACGGTVTPAVKQDGAYVSGISLRYNGEEIQGNSLRLDLASEGHAFTADVTRTGTISGDVTFKSSDKDVATVSDTGEMTLVGAGETVISATSVADANYTAYVAVTVVSDVQKTYKVTVKGGGTANVAEAAEGTIVTLKAQPPEGMAFTGWTYSVKDLWINGNTFRMPASDVIVTANYGGTLDYRLEVQDGTWTAEGVEAGARIPYGTKVTLTCTAEVPVGQRLSGWTTGDEALDASLNIENNTFNMPGRNISLLPEFDYIDYKVSVKGGVAPEQTAHYGDTVTLSPDYTKAPKGQILLGWKGLDEERTLYSNTFEMPAKDVQLEAVYGRAQVAALSASYDYGSGTAGTAGATDIDGLAGRSYAFAKTAKAGSKLRIKGGGVPYGPYPVVMEVTLRNENKSDISLEYTLDYYEANYSTGVLTVKGGTTLKAYLYVPKGELDESDVEDGVASPYHVMFLSKDLNEEDYFYLDVAVQYKVLDGVKDPATYSLSVKDGTYTVAGGYTVPAAGDKVTLAPAAKEGYRFKGWRVVKGTVEIEDNSFVMPAEAVEIEAVYKQIVYYAIAVEGGTASVGGADAAKAEAGQTVVLTPEEREGFEFESWQVVEGNVTIQENTFTMPAANVSVKAIYRQLVEHTVTVQKGGTASVAKAMKGDLVTTTVDGSLAPAGQIFVGWKGVLEGDAISFGSSFVMPDKDVTLTPVYAAATKAKNLSSAMDNGTGTTPITGKHTTVSIGKESADCYEMPATYTAGTLVRIRGGNIFTGDANTPGVPQVAAITFQNNGKYDITFNYFLENTMRDEEGNDLYKYNIAETGNITVKAGETLTVYMYVPADNAGATPYPAIKFASDVGGQSGETFKLAMYTYLSDVSALA